MTKTTTLFQVGESIKVDETYDVTIQAVEQGGMGYVIIGPNHADHDRIVVFKTYQPDLNQKNPTIKERFIREAITWIKLWLHPNILYASAAFTITNATERWNNWGVSQPYIQLEYAPDGDLKRLLIERGRLSLGQALWCAQQIAAGVQVLHTPDPILGRDSIIHRDLKPANVLRNGDCLMLTDFGLAKIITQVEMEANDSGQSGGMYQTHVGQRGIGTAPYMAPEQWRAGAEMDTKIDIYAIGVILAELLAGNEQYPLKGRTREEWCEAHLHAQPRSLRELGVAVPPALEDLFQACLAKDPANRPKVSEVVITLQQIATEANLPVYYPEEITSHIAQNQSVIWVRLGFSYGQLDLHKEQCKAYQQAVAIDPQSGRAWNGLSDAYIIAKEFTKALDASDHAIALEPDNATIWSQRSTVLLFNQRYAEGIDALERAAALDPWYNTMWNKRAILLWGSTGTPQYEWALIMYDRAIASNPKDFSAWNNKITVLLRLKRYDEAYQVCKGIMALAPPENDIWWVLGNQLNSLQKYDEALTAFDRAIVVTPDNFSAWLGKTGALAQLKRYREVVVASDRAIALNPQNAEVWVHRGFALANLQRTTEALAALDQALALNANQPAAWYYKAQILRLLGRLPEDAQAEAQVRKLNQQA